jgi:hypothetical protein
MDHESDVPTGGGELPAAPITQGRAWFGRRRRKRVAAREVEATAVTSAASGNAIVEAPEPPATPTLPESVLDPTLLGERHRKHSQNFAYRLTQVAALLSLIAACGAILSVLLEDVHLGRISAGVACLLGVSSVWLVKRSRLAYRLRGYAAAACVLAAIALAVSLIVAAPPEENKPGGAATSKAATSQSS